MDLHDLALLMPRAVAWAEAIAAHVGSAGDPLNASAILDAKAVDVQRPEEVRVQMVDRLPLPSDSELRAAALRTRLLGPTMAGLTLGRSILVCHGQLSRRFVVA